MLFIQDSRPEQKSLKAQKWRCGLKVLYLGGARSGKSRLARLAAEALTPAGRRIFVATAQALDQEMAERIAAHRAERGKTWRTIEESISLAPILEAAQPKNVYLVDCLTMWLSNIMTLRPDEVAGVEEELTRLVEAVRQCPGHLFLVANELGSGIVPENPLARRYRDRAGFLNQSLAGVVDQVHLIIAGLEIRLK
jgi:adenosylcobinamide kinase/adenosylcobinamide-phosphate guanylyltransferase